MKPWMMFGGTKSRAGCGLSAPLSYFGLSFLIAKPWASPSVPGRVKPPASEVQVALSAVAAKSRVTLPALLLGTLISTHQDLLAVIPIPKTVPVELLNFQ